PLDIRSETLQYLQPFSTHGYRRIREASSVAPRIGETWYQALSEWLAYSRKNDRNNTCIRPKRHCGKRRVPNENIKLESDQFLSTSPRLLLFTCAPAIIDPDVVAICPTQLLEFVPECRQTAF